MSEKKTVLKASLTGTFSSKDETVPQAYKITVMYSDGSKMVLRKTYHDFIELQSTVHDLLHQRGGYSKKTAKSIVKSLPELNSSFSQSIFKESDLKKMERLEKFMKELLTLPAVVRESESVTEFFSAFGEKQDTSERSKNEEELKKINKAVEVLSGRDPLRTLPERPVLRMLGRQNRTDLSSEDQKPPGKKIQTRPPLIKRTISDKSGFKETSLVSSKPGLTKRQFSVGVGIAEMFKDNLTSITNMTEGEHSQSTGATPGPAVVNNEKQSKDDKISGDEKKIKSGMEEPCVQMISSQNKTSHNGMKYVAISAYVPEESGEVSLEGEELIDVLVKSPDGWWYVKKENGEGWVPGTFLEPVHLSASKPAPETLDLSRGKEILDAISEEAVVEESEIGSLLDEKQKITEALIQANEEKSEENKSADMDRRLKLVSVEGVQKRKTPDKNYVYILKVLWSDGSINIIYRQCSDFFLLQENLKKEFPKGSGKEIPALKGKKFTEKCQFCFKDGTCKRRQSLNKFFHDLVNAPDVISNCQAVMLFCRARPSDLHPHRTSSNSNNKKDSESDHHDSFQISGPVVFEQYIVIADYKKKNKNDISLTAGNTVDVIEKNDFGWWLVDREGELGWAPASHLEPIDDGEELTSSKTFATGQEEVYYSRQSYQARAEDELSFDIGVTFEILEKNLDGWWLARYQGKEGWVPAVFLSRAFGSDGSSSSSSGNICGLDIMSSDGDSENGDGKRGRRSPPTRRSMVRRSLKNKLNLTPTTRHLSESSIAEELGSSVSEKVETAQEDTTSLSSGYRTSSSNSLSSLVFDAATTDERTQCAIPGSVDICAVNTALSPVSSQSNHVTALASDGNILETAVNGSGSNSAGRRSPIPMPRSKSPRRNPMASSQPKIHSSEQQQVNDFQNTKYRAMYSYTSQEKNEITMNEGDIVQVLKRNSNGWWLLNANDHLGWGPSNFLQAV